MQTFQIALLACIGFFLFTYWAFGRASEKANEESAKTSELQARPLKIIPPSPADRKVAGFLNGISTLSFFFGLLFSIVLVVMSTFPASAISTSTNYTYSNVTLFTNTTTCQGGWFNGTGCSAGNLSNQVVYSQQPVVLSFVSSSEDKPSEAVSNVMGFMTLFIGLYFLIVFVWFLLEGARPIWERFTRGGR